MCRKYCYLFSKGSVEKIKKTQPFHHFCLQLANITRHGDLTSAALKLVSLMLYLGYSLIFMVNQSKIGYLACLITRKLSRAKMACLDFFILLTM